MEVINEDYNDFISLSTKLVNVDGAVLRMQKPLLEVKVRTCTPLGVPSISFSIGGPKKIVLWSLISLFSLLPRYVSGCKHGKHPKNQEGSLPLCPLGVPYLNQPGLQLAGCGYCLFSLPETVGEEEERLHQCLVVGF